MSRPAALSSGLAAALATALARAGPVYADHGSPFGFLEGGLGPGWWVVFLMAPLPYLLAAAIFLALRRRSRGSGR